MGHHTLIKGEDIHLLNSLQKNRLAGLRLISSRFLNINHTIPRQTTQRVLSPDLSVQVLHRLYQEKCAESNKEAVILWVYRWVFNVSILDLKSVPLHTCTYIRTYTHMHTHSVMYIHTVHTHIHVHLLGNTMSAKLPLNFHTLFAHTAQSRTHARSVIHSK